MWFSDLVPQLTNWESLIMTLRPGHHSQSLQCLLKNDTTIQTFSFSCGNLPPSSNNIPLALENIKNQSKEISYCIMIRSRPRFHLSKGAILLASSTLKAKWWPNQTKWICCDPWNPHGHHLQGQDHHGHHLHGQDHHSHHLQGQDAQVGGEQSGGGETNQAKSSAPVEGGQLQSKNQDLEVKSIIVTGWASGWTTHLDKGHKLTRTKGTIVKTSSLLELKLVTSLSLNFLMGVRHHCRRDVMVNLKMMVMLLARAVLQKRRMEARRKSCLVNIF